MTKRILGKSKDGQSLWIIAPNIVTKSYSEKSNLTNLDTFHFFAQALIKPQSENPTEEEKKKIIATKKSMLIDLDNKVVKLKFFANEIKMQEKKLVQQNMLRKKYMTINHVRFLSD